MIKKKVKLNLKKTPFRFAFFRSKIQRGNYKNITPLEKALFSIRERKEKWQMRHSKFNKKLKIL
jgi:hypothetical protein